ncbi:MAG: DUF748 domain-containing protein [Mariprofundales bacterium]
MLTRMAGGMHCLLAVVMRSLLTKRAALVCALMLLALLLLWQAQNRLAGMALDRYLPDLQYAGVRLNLLYGQFAVRGVKVQMPGVTMKDGVVVLDFDPTTLLSDAIVLNKVILKQGRITVDPEKIASQADGAAVGVKLPDKIVVLGAVVTVVHADLPHLQPLHLKGEADLRDDGWFFRSKLQLSQGVLRGEGVMVGSLLQGTLQAESVTFSALLRQLGIADAKRNLQGTINGAVAWKFPLAAPEQMEAEGEVHLDGVAATVLGDRQQADGVAVKLAWQGGSRMVTIEQMKMERVALRGSNRLLQGGGVNVDGDNAIHWQLDQLSVSGGSVDVEIATAAGSVQLPLRLQRLDLQGVTWRGGWPKRSDLQVTLQGGSIALSQRASHVGLTVHKVPLTTLGPLIVSATALRIPQGELDVSLQGDIAPKLKLFGEATMRHLVLAPRIPVQGVDMSIPYEFGLRALTDEDGVTHIPLMFSGTVAKPDLKTSLIISNVKKNLFNRNLDGGVDNLSIGFLAQRKVNQQRLTPTGVKMMARLIKQLQENHALKVSIRGCVSDKAGLHARRVQQLAAARVQMVRTLLKRSLHRDVVEAVIYPTLTKPSPDIDGKKDRVEVSVHL